MNKRLKRTSAAWTKAAKELGISVEAPYILQDREGQTFEIIAYLSEKWQGVRSQHLILLQNPLFLGKCVAF